MTRFRLLIPAAFALGLTASMSLAQTYPSQSETPVTDDADLLPAVAEAELASRLVALEQQSNTDLAVVTLLSMALYTGGDDLDVYARNLMADWDMGAATNGRRVLVLVFKDDREMHVEINGDFSEAAIAAGTATVDDTFLPAFRQDEYPGGIAAGVEAIAAGLLFAPAPAETAPEAPAAAEAVAETETAASEDSEGGGNALIWVGGVVAAIIAAIVGLNRRSAAKLAATPCPSCGKTGMTRSRVTLVEATETTEGSGETRLTCPSCGHVEATPFTISAKPAKETPPDDDAPKSGGKSGSW